MTKRSLCPICQYPQNVCICSAVTPMTSPLNIVVLQHPKETLHAKNTARLMKLCLPQTQLYVGQNPEDFIQLRESLNTNNDAVWVLFPNPASEALDVTRASHFESVPDTLIVIDATWRKAKKIWHLNSWLHQLPSWHFQNVPHSSYRIRKSSLPHSLSTLEATAYALEQLTHVDTEPMFRVFEAMQKQQERFSTHQPV